MFNIIINIINIIIFIIINKFEKILLLLKRNHKFDLNGKIKNYYCCCCCYSFYYC
jgi:hypothetical protein